MKVVAAFSSFVISPFFSPLFDVGLKKVGRQMSNLRAGNSVSQLKNQAS